MKKLILDEAQFDNKGWVRKSIPLLSNKKITEKYDIVDIEGENDSVFITDNINDVVNDIKSKKWEEYKFVLDDYFERYIKLDPFETIHDDAFDLAFDNYWYPELCYSNQKIEGKIPYSEYKDEHWNKELQYIMVTYGQDENGKPKDIGQDYFSIAYVYDDFNILSRTPNFVNTILYKKLGKEKQIVEAKEDELYVEGIYTNLVGKVDGDDIFDTNYADSMNDLLHNKDYFLNHKNTKFDIVQMTPREYFEGCSKIFGNSYEANIRQVKDDKEIIDKLKNVILKDKEKFPITYLDYRDLSVGGGQEGRHRMYVAGELFGWEHKFPVMVIDYADKELALKNKKIEEESKIYDNINEAVLNSIVYKYNNIDEFRDELEYQLEKSFYNADIKFDFDEYDDFINITVDSVTYKLDKKEIDINNTDIDITDFEDDEDFIKEFELNEEINNKNPTNSNNINENKNGKIIAYHGSQQNDLEFIKDQPLYLTNNKDTAIDFANGYAFNYDIQEKDKPTLYTMELTLLKPKYITTEEEYDKLMDIANSEFVIPQLKKEGFDSLVYEDENGLIYYMLFNPQTQAHIIDKEEINKSNINEAKENVDIVAEVERVFGTSTEPMLGPTYIMPNGEFLKIPTPEQMKASGLFSYKCHSLIYAWLVMKKLVKGTIWDINDLHDLEDKGCIRVNLGNIPDEDALLNYIQLTKKKPNVEQQEAILKWLDFAEHNKIPQIEVQTGMWGSIKSYSFTDYTSDDILNKITNYYSVGKLVEEVNVQDKEKIINELNNRFKGDTIYTDEIEEYLQDKFNNLSSMDIFNIVYDWAEDNNKETVSENTHTWYNLDNKYERRQRNIDNRNEKDRHLLISQGVEEYVELLEDITKMRHEIHSNQRSWFNPETYEYRQFNKWMNTINDRLEEVGLKGIPFRYDTSDMIDSSWVTGDIDDGYETEEEAYSDFVDQVETNNKIIEDWLREFDNKYATHYAPTGWARLQN